MAENPAPPLERVGTLHATNRDREPVERSRSSGGSRRWHLKKRAAEALHRLNVHAHEIVASQEVSGSHPVIDKQLRFTTETGTIAPVAASLSNNCAVQWP
jgi:hypothetical protein